MGKKINDILKTLMEDIPRLKHYFALTTFMHTNLLSNMTAIVWSNKWDIPAYTLQWETTAGWQLWQRDWWLLSWWSRNWVERYTHIHKNKIKTPKQLTSINQKVWCSRSWNAQNHWIIATLHRRTQALQLSFSKGKPPLKDNSSQVSPHLKQVPL